jgi:dolichol-phosphate mannosyltransferase
MDNKILYTTILPSMTIEQTDHTKPGSTRPFGVVNKSDWSIPSHTVSFWKGRTHDHCVIIPVINEGERIIRLLQRMESVGVADIADIIIIDGGSTDNSLDPSKLQALRVQALIIKTGSGKLSAQLRCAYSFALEAGFAGIITIDGNDKDDPEPISRMVCALKDGADFLQASRFIEGGVAENTPLSRYVAIRLIHAPLLSFFSGFQWTDTTQGFRAYSARMLLDPRVRPFRDCFNSSELLAYLSYRAPRLGFRCSEIATSRRYPRDEVPTKISVIRGNMRVLLILVKACLGSYDPRD